MSRTFGLLCLAAFLWFAGLVASPAPSSLTAVRGAAEIALHAARTNPALAAPRVDSAPALQRFSAERYPPPVQTASSVLGVRAAAAIAGGRLSILSRQSAAHDARALWRAYDANAPPRSLAVQS